MMEVTQTALPGVVIIEPKVFGDSRGYFFESFRQDEFAEKVCGTVFVQDNQSRSVRGVVRGLHFQLPPSAQSKLVRVAVGRIYDVAVDVRLGSPTFGKYVGVELSDENHRQLFIPRGFAHGFATLSEVAVVQYKCDNYYDPASEGGIAWNDPSIGVRWPFATGEAILSEKDARYPVLAETEHLFDYRDKLY